MLSDMMLSVIMLSVVMLSVLAPMTLYKTLKIRNRQKMDSLFLILLTCLLLLSYLSYLIDCLCRIFKTSLTPSLSELGATTFNKMTFSVNTFSIMKLSISTFSTHLQLSVQMSVVMLNVTFFVMLSVVHAEC
jgi:hypothetical protein